MKLENSKGAAVNFAIRKWAAWAPGIEGEAAWRAWAESPSTPIGTDVPGLTQMSSMLRRRLGPLGRMACEVAYAVTDAEAPVPMIFASQHGEVARTELLFAAIERGGPVSPTEFSMSVHNAISGLFSISSKDVGNYIAIAAGSETAPAAAVEAAALLADGAAEVVVVVYDERVPETYSEFVEEPEAAFAWACRLAMPSATDRTLSLSLTINTSDCADSDGNDTMLPAALAAFRAICGNHTVTHVLGNKCWTWSGYAADA